MQQLLLEQQKQQTLLLNQQELLMGLQEGHRELMETVQHKKVNDSHNSEREWWIKKLLQQSSSLPTIPKQSDTLKSQSFPNLRNSSQAHLTDHKEVTVSNNTAINMHGQKLTKEKSISNNLSFKEANGEETVLESQRSLTQASVGIETFKDSSPTHNPTYQSCGTNTHNLVDVAVNTAPMTVDICVGTEWAISSSSSDDDESEKPSRTVDSSETSPQNTKEQRTSTTTTSPEKEPPTEDSVDGPNQPQASSSSPDHLSYPNVINQEVLARSMDGCYYWGVVLQYNQQQDSYIIEDLDSRQQLMMTRSDFITETQDAARTVLQLYDRALAPRILSPNCFLPGRCVTKHKVLVHIKLIVCHVHIFQNFTLEHLLHESCLLVVFF